MHDTRRRGLGRRAASVACEDLSANVVEQAKKLALHVLGASPARTPIPQTTHILDTAHLGR